MNAPRMIRAVSATTAAAAALVFLTACVGDGPDGPSETPTPTASSGEPNGTTSPPVSGVVLATAETAPFPSGEDDVADDPAIWVDPADGDRSVIIGTSKAEDGGGLGVYDLDGEEIQFLVVGSLNNVDLRSDVLGGRVLVVATNRTDSELAYFFLDPADRTLSTAGATSLPYEPYGTCLYVSPVDQQVYAFVTEATETSGRFEQYRLSSAGSEVTGTQVRGTSTSSQSEGCAADDEGASVFLAQELEGLFRFAAEPDEEMDQIVVDLATGPNLVPDVEGVAIARDPDGSDDYLVVSSQGDNSFQVYDLAAPYEHRRSFTVEGGDSIDDVTETDGLDVTRYHLGPRFPDGLLVVHDTDNEGAPMSNFKLVDAGQVFAPLAGR